VTAPHKIQNFVFRGLLLHSTFDEFEGTEVAFGPARDADEEDRDGDISLEDFSAAIRLQAVKMAAVYQAFFCFENSVRELVEERLKEQMGTDWWQKGTTVPIRNRVDGRKTKERSNRWHGPRGEREIDYADFGDLALIITNNWDMFEDLFPDQDWVRTRLSDLEMSRNVMAHNGVLTGREITRITLYLKDWVMQVG
jgi:Swt1-like HEPN